MELFGYQNSLMALIDAPATCRRLLAVFTRMVAAQAQCYAACDPDAILISSAFAGAGFISREMYREFVLPCEKELVGVVRPSGIPVYTHTCGAIGDRLDLMAATEIDGIDTLDPPPLGTVNLRRPRRNLAGGCSSRGISMRCTRCFRRTTRRSRRPSLSV